jgi:hypothetical protein
MKDTELIEPALILVITNRRGVLGDKTWCLENHRISLEQIADTLYAGGIKNLYDMYPQLKKSKSIELLDKEEGDQ